MSLLPGLTFSAPGISLYGGGGGGSNFSTLTVSSIQAQNTTLDLIGNLQVNGGVLQFSGGPSVIENSVITTSSLVVSSINGAAPGGASIQSTIANAGSFINIPVGASPMAFNILEGANFTSPGNAQGFQVNGNIINNGTAPAQMLSGLVATSLSTVTLNCSTINGTVPGASVSPPNLTLSTLSLIGGTNGISLVSNNLAQAIISGSGITGLDLVNVRNINGGVPLLFATQPFTTAPSFQSGYRQDVPYLSTILFSVPYPNDTVCVQLTATNRNVSGGANPNISLNNAFGVNGVSSIGFQADTRDNGLGYAGSFYFTAVSL